jgi:hypothetical protein
MKDLPRTSSGTWSSGGTAPPLHSAELVTVCPKCAAYVQDAKAHKRWHKQSNKPWIAVMQGPQGQPGPQGISGASA